LVVVNVSPLACARVKRGFDAPVRACGVAGRGQGDRDARSRPREWCSSG
jgi:hypothetical protein